MITWDVFPQLKFHSRVFPYTSGFLKIQLAVYYLDALSGDQTLFSLGCRRVFNLDSLRGDLILSSLASVDVSFQVPLVFLMVACRHV